MKGLEGLIRVGRWRLMEQRRKLSELEGLALQLQRERAQVKTELESESTGQGNEIEAVRAYSRYLEVALERLQRFDDSLEELQQKIYDAHEEVTESFAELKRYELAAAKRRERAEKLQRRREQITLDEVGLNVHRRRTADAG